MKIEKVILVHPLIRAQARHRFYYLHESRENLMAQLRISSIELELALRPTRFKKCR